MTGRAIRNPFVNKVKNGEYPEVKCPYQCLRNCSKIYCIIDALINAQEGRMDTGMVFSGANVWRLKGKKVQPAGEIMAELVKEAG